MSNCEGNVYHIGMGCCVPKIVNPDLYYTKEEVDKKIDDIEVSGVTEEKAQEMIDESLEGYYTKEESNDLLDTKVTKNYLAFVALEDGTFGFSASTTGSPIEYSIDGGSSWSALESGSTPTVERGKKILWKGKLRHGMYANNGIGRFSSTGKFDIEGNVASILYDNDFEGITTSNVYLCGLFRNCAVVSAEKLVLPFETVEGLQYQLMFGFCTELKKAPKLIAKTVKYNGYDAMFQRCESLTEAPDLPATSLGERCYNNMFNGCTSLLKAPDLLVEELVQGCYTDMFANCSSLNYIKAMFLTDPYVVGSGTPYTNDWVYQVASAGTFVMNAEANWRYLHYNNAIIPNGWTIEKTTEGYATKDWVSGYTYDKQTIEDMIEEGGGFIPENYYTKTDVDGLVSDLEAADSVISGAVDNVSNELHNNYYTKGGVLDAISAATSIKADVTALTQTNNALVTHRTDSGIHVTSSEKETWNNKSDFSGDYNDLTNKPTIPVVPTNVSAFNNDSGYITIDAISGKADTSAVTQAISAAVSGKADSNTVYTKTEVNTALSGKQNTLTAGSGITISNDTISAKIWSGTKAAYEALTTKDSDTIYLIYNE